MFKFLDILFPPRADEKVLRNISLETFLSSLNPQLIPITRPDVIALSSFSDISVRAAIHEAKYHYNEKAFNLLSSMFAEYFRDCDNVGPRRSYIVPVPLGKERLKNRGFNQVEEIVRHALQRLSADGENTIILKSDLLSRSRETTSQVSLPRHKREENMRGAFKATRRADPSYTYIVIDDVATTGATLQAAIDALKEAGATHIIPFALAH